MEPVHLHPSAVLLHQTPEYVVFQEVSETSKLYMRGVCAVDPAWLPQLQPQFCTFSDPLEDPPPFFDDGTGTVKCHMTCTYGECACHMLCHMTCLLHVACCHMTCTCDVKCMSHDFTYMSSMYITYMCIHVT